MKDRVFGTIIRIRGPVIDIRFAEGEEPKINSIVSTENGNFHMEVAAQISAGTVRNRRRKVRTSCLVRRRGDQGARRRRRDRARC